MGCSCDRTGIVLLVMEQTTSIAIGFILKAAHIPQCDEWWCLLYASIIVPVAIAALLLVFFFLYVIYRNYYRCTCQSPASAVTPIFIIPDDVSLPITP